MAKKVRLIDVSIAKVGAEDGQNALEVMLDAAGDYEGVGVGGVVIGATSPNATLVVSRKGDGYFMLYNINGLVSHYAVGPNPVKYLSLELALYAVKDGFAKIKPRPKDKPIIKHASQLLEHIISAAKSQIDSRQLTRVQVRNKPHQAEMLSKYMQRKSIPMASRALIGAIALVNQLEPELDAANAKILALEALVRRQTGAICQLHLSIKAHVDAQRLLNELSELSAQQILDRNEHPTDLLIRQGRGVNRG